jgi:hypothetical protein
MGIEPTTPEFRVRCSAGLSYGCKPFGWLTPPSHMLHAHRMDGLDVSRTTRFNCIKKLAPPAGFEPNDLQTSLSGALTLSYRGMIYFDRTITSVHSLACFVRTRGESHFLPQKLQVRFFFMHL